MVNFQLRRFIEDVILERGYQLVYTPNVTREQLFLRSGHLPLYAENQFPPMAAGEGEAEDVRYRVKPMNCPMHILVYASQQRSYRDLPIRLAEIANVYRNERSGTLHGMLRVRGLSMDDAHIFLREDQIEDEIFQLLDIVELVLGKTFGLTYRLDLATRPAKKLGSDAVWDTAERGLEQALKRRGITYRLDKAGGAFYGPKIDVKFNDAIGREWQGATIQLDYELPERFQLEYTGSDNKPHRPVMIHRAIYGTLERFVGFLIEHFAGAFPLWLSPEQVRVLPIADTQLDAARSTAEALRKAGMRVHLDDRSETLNYKVRDGEMQKVPYLAVVGQREAEAGTVAVRVRGAGKKQEILSLDEFVRRLQEEVRTRSLTPLV
jgi:threonyl-tRNA synthetase